MSEWTSGKEALYRCNIKGIELLKFVTDGLQPYNKIGKPVPPPDIQVKFDKLERLKKRLDELASYNKRPAPKPIQRFRELEELKRYKNEISKWKEQVLKLEQELSNPSAMKWLNYIIPDTEKEAKKIINLLVNSFYKSEDILILEKKINQKSKISKKLIANQKDSKIIEIIRAVTPELERVYSAICDEITFSSKIEKQEEHLLKVAIKQIKQNQTYYKILKEEDLADEEIYSFNDRQRKRDILGNILKRIIQRKGLGPIGYQCLYRLYLLHRH